MDLQKKIFLILFFTFLNCSNSKEKVDPILDVQSDLSDLRADSKDLPSTSLAGFYQIEVNYLKGDDMWIYVAQPDNWDPSKGTVIFGHGQGATNTLPCGELEKAPTHANVPSTLTLIDHLADEGYLSVGIFYRNFGPSGGLPGAKLRDGRRDGAAMLSAAQWIKARLNIAEPLPVTMLGISMGTMAVFYASSNEPSLAELQKGLDIKRAILVGFTLNLMANATRSILPLVNANSLQKKKSFIISMAFISAILINAELGELSPTTWGDPQFRDLIESILTPAGEIMLRSFFVEDPKSLDFPPCSTMDKIPAFCFCAADLFDAVWKVTDPDSFASGDIDYRKWFKEDALSAFIFWDAKKRMPTTAEMSANPVLASLARVTPLGGPLKISNLPVSILFSTNDHVTNAHGVESKTLLVDLFSDSQTFEFSEDAKGACGHGEFFLEDRACGFQKILDILKETFK